MTIKINLHLKRHLFISYINLRYIPAKENLKKNKKSHKFIDTLIKEYEAEKRKHRGNITENVMISN